MPGSASFWSQSGYDELEEFSRNVKVSLLGVSPKGPSSFLPTSEDSLPDDWMEWADFQFLKLIGPAFRTTFDLGNEMKLREVAEIDWELGEALGEEVASLMVESTTPFIEGKEKMRGHREWIQYVRKIQDGLAPGHLPIMFALHSVLFRMPLASALQAYCWYEWKMGYFSIGRSRLSGEAENPPDLFLEIRSRIRLVLSDGGEEIEGGPNLKVV